MSLTFDRLAIQLSKSEEQIGNPSDVILSTLFSMKIKKSQFKRIYVYLLVGLNLNYLLCVWSLFCSTIRFAIISLR